MNAIQYSQDNLAANPENMNLAQALIDQVKDSSKKLTDEYKDYW